MTVKNKHHKYNQIDLLRPPMGVVLQQENVIGNFRNALGKKDTEIITFKFPHYHKTIPFAVIFNPCVIFI